MNNNRDSDNQFQCQQYRLMWNYSKSCRTHQEICMRYSNEKKECGGGIHLLAVCCGFMGSVCSSDVLCERQMQTAAGSVLEKHRYVIPNELKQEKPESFRRSQFSWSPDQFTLLLKTPFFGCLRPEYICSHQPSRF